MAYLVQYDTDDREILEYELEGGQPAELDLESDGKVFPRGIILPKMTLQSCISLSIRTPKAFAAAVPVRIKIKPQRDGYIPDFAPAARYFGSLVTQRFADLVEALEPGTHQFFPIQETVDTSGRNLGKRFCLMNILARVDALVEELSDVQHVRVSSKSQDTMLAIKMGLGRKPILTLRRTAIQGHHVWFGERGKLSNCRFFSDQLHDEVIKEGFSPMNYLRCDEL
jgi:hypothetical protein